MSADRASLTILQIPRAAVFLTPVSGHNCPLGVDKNYGVFQVVITSQVFI